jgi:hypothetical protein
VAGGDLHDAFLSVAIRVVVRTATERKPLMNLLTNTQRAQLLENGRRSELDEHFDPFPVVKLFTPDAGCTWLLSELDPAYADRAFGLCDLGMGYPELGYVSLSELVSIRGGLGLPIERDLYFTAEKPLSGYATEARANGVIRA